MKHIDGKPFLHMMGKPAASYLGVEPELRWIAISHLRIDPAYQREVLRQGARNIAKIARNFDWSLFGIVVVADVGGGLFAIVDGQHRTIAASMREIEAVPCLIIDADKSRQAAAFAAINGAVTAVSPLAIFAAKVAAEDENAMALVADCKLGGVSICRYPVPSDKMSAGETLAIGALQSCRSMFGRETLIMALKCITIGGESRTGLVKAPVIKAFCHVLDAESSWRSHPGLLSAAAKFDLASALQEAEAAAGRTRRVNAQLAMALFDYLDEVLGS